MKITSLPEHFQNALEDRIWLGQSETDLRKEIDENCWKLGLDESERQGVGAGELRAWVDALVVDRRAQAEQLSPLRGATFYLWFSQQDQALCINVLSSAQRELPFGCTVRPSESPDGMIAAFLADPWSDDPALAGWDIFKRDRESDLVERDPKAFVLDVYVVRYSGNT